MRIVYTTKTKNAISADNLEAIEEASEFTAYDSDSRTALATRTTALRTHRREDQVTSAILENTDGQDSKDIEDNLFLGTIAFGAQYGKQYSYGAVARTLLIQGHTAYDMCLGDSQAFFVQRDEKGKPLAVTGYNQDPQSE